MSIYAFSIDQNSDQFGPRTFREYFSPDECRELLSLTRDFESNDGGIVKGEHSEDSEVNPDIRHVSIKIIPVNESSMWIYNKIDKVVRDANQSFKFNLVGMMEQMQLLHYGDDIEGGHYGWHVDIGTGPLSTRKLSVVVQLTDPSEYEGCDLELFGWDNAANEIGSVTVFPSFMHHRVTEILSGQRDSLIVWVNGPPYT